jgi:hypothetical protein
MRDQQSGREIYGKSLVNAAKHALIFCDVSAPCLLPALPVAAGAGENWEFDRALATPRLDEVLFFFSFSVADRGAALRVCPGHFGLGR